MRGITHPYYNVTLHVSVTDAAELWSAAHTNLSDCGLERAEIRASIGTKRRPDISGCLRVLLDRVDIYPGFEISDSSVD